ncbi:hypothetical protein KP509_34G058700 [Ceratopteris richardii]|nr:hypothetical protein KP509_34G058700 [Ceratopteris richardii]
MQKRKVSAKLTKSPRGKWRVKISKISTIISAPLSSLSESYIRMMNGLSEKGNLSELAVLDSAGPATNFHGYQPGSTHYDHLQPQVRKFA